jgi:hypothetical protein
MNEMHMRKNMYCFRWLVITGTFTILALPGQAQQLDGGWKPTPLELARLPKYCQGQLSPELAGRPGYSITGCGKYFNHYCPGLVALSRAENIAAPKKDRQYNKGRAHGHLKYTRDHVPPTCPLLRELALAESRLRVLDFTLK